MEEKIDQLVEHTAGVVKRNIEIQTDIIVLCDRVDALNHSGKKGAKAGAITGSIGGIIMLAFVGFYSYLRTRFRWLP